MKPLSLRQERTIKAFVGKDAGNKAAAMRTGGYKESTAAKQQARVFDDPKVRKRIEELLADNGLTEDHVALRLKEGTNAEFITKDGTVCHGIPDFKERREACVVTLKILGNSKERMEIKAVASAWSERVALIVERCACAKCKPVIFDAIITELSTPSEC